MSKKIDMTGRRFGLLTVTGPAGSKNGKAMWACRCDCGAAVTAEGSNLRRGLTRSCGDSAHRHMRGKPQKHVDLTGRTFGELTAVRFVGRDRWLWRCSCGREAEIRASRVKRGEVISCGHVLREKARERVTRDNVFGLGDGTNASVVRSILRGKVRSTNTSGITGVRIREHKGRVSYAARIVVRGKEIRLGTFDTLEQAAEARRKAEETYFRPIAEKQP